MVLQDGGIGYEAKKERYKCKTDLFYLGKYWLGFDFVESVHRPVCDFFVRKQPDKAIEEQDAVKDRLLLDPRGHYKTTIDACDIVQWIICFPDIRISVFSGAEDLVIQITDMVINQFRLNDRFKELFFEHSIDAKEDYNRHNWNTPARSPESILKKRGPTLFATTIGSVNTGTHCEVMKFDDVVTDLNSETPERRAKINNRVNALVPLVEPGGYTDFIGTRYAFDDKYGEFIEELEKPQVREVIPFGDIIHTETAKAFKRTVCDIEATGEITKDSVFLFPQRSDGKVAFDLEEIRRRRRKLSDEQFGAQYLNDPQWGVEGAFREADLKAALIPTNAIPFQERNPLSGANRPNLKCFQVWDLAFSEKKHADRTVGVCGAFDKYGRLYILDLEAGRFSPEDFVVKFLQFYVKWLPIMGRVGIEDAGGSKLIGPALKASAVQANLPLSIDWLKVENRQTKRERVYGLLPLLKHRKLFINNAIPYLSDFIKEFTQFPKGKHDDIPDAVSRLLEYQSAIDIVAINQPQQYIAEQPYTSELGYGLIG